MVVGPVITSTTHHIGLIPGEVFVHRVHGIRREWCGVLTKFFEDEQIIGWQFCIRKIATWAQHVTTCSVERVVATHIGARFYCPHEREHFGFTHRVVTRTKHINAPTCWEVAVEI